MSSALRSLYVAEPPPQYQVRPSLVVDCSVLAALLFQEHWQLQAQQRMEGRSLKAPWLLDVELAHVAVKKHRAGFAEIARDALESYASMDIERFTTAPHALHGLALRYQLDAFDAAYLWLAAELKCPLATFDEKLATAAQAHLSALS